MSWRLSDARHFRAKLSASGGCFALNNPPEADRWKRPTRPACWGEAESEDQRVKINAIK